MSAQPAALPNSIRIEARYCSPRRGSGAPVVVWLTDLGLNVAKDAYVTKIDTPNETIFSEVDKKQMALASVSSKYRMEMDFAAIEAAGIELSKGDF